MRRILVLLLLLTLPVLAQNPPVRWQGGTDNPPAAGCDSAAEMGGLYVQAGNPATTANQVHTCRQVGASTWAWHPVSHFAGTTLPATCSSGQLAIDTDGPSGQRLYACEAGAWVLQGDGGGAGGTANYVSNFTAQTSITVTGGTHNFGHANIFVQCYDNASPTAIITPSSITIDTSTFDVVISFAVSTTGRCILQGNGGPGDVTGGTTLTTVSVIPRVTGSGVLGPSFLSCTASPATCLLYDTTATTGASVFRIRPNTGNGIDPIFAITDTAGTNDIFQLAFNGAVDTSVEFRLGAVAGNNFAQFDLKSGGGGSGGDHAVLKYSSAATQKWAVAGVWNGVADYVILDAEAAFVPRLTINKTTGIVTIPAVVRAADPAASGDVTTRGATWTDGEFVRLSSGKLLTATKTGTGTQVVMSNTPTITTPVIQSYTIATLPAAGTAGRIAEVTNAGAPGRCSGTAGIYRSLCYDTGTIWRSMGDGPSGAPLGNAVVVDSIINTSGSPAYGAFWWAQTFTPTTSHKLYGIGARLGTFDSPQKDCTLTINNSTAGRPGSTVLVSKTFTSPSGVGSDFFRVMFASPLSVTAGVKYSIVLSCPDSTVTFPVTWYTTFSEDIYQGGDLFHSSDSGANWNLLTESPDNLNDGEDAFFYEILNEVTALDDATVGRVLRVTGTNTYAFGALDLADADAVTGLLPEANIAAAIARDSEVAAAYQPLDAALTALAGGSDFVAFSGPATSTKTFTLPNASSTILTTNDPVTPSQLSAAARQDSRSIVIFEPATGDTNLAQLAFANAVTLQRVWCSIDAGTSVTIQLDERAEATPNTAGTNVLTSSLVCDTNTEATTSFTNATIAANVPLNLQISAVSGTVGAVRIHVAYQID